jgi:serine/threonine protein phosphatase PrpC
MITHRRNSRRSLSFRLPFFFLCAWLIIALHVGFTSLAFAAAQQTPTPLPSQDVTRAGVSVVRLLVSYKSSADATNTGPTANSTIMCTGLGVFVLSQLMSGSVSRYENWVLTDGSLINTANKATCLPAEPDAKLTNIIIYTSTGYNSQQTIKFTVHAADISVRCLSSDPSCANSPALLSFTSSADEPQPFLDLAAGQTSGTTNKTAEGKALALTQSDASLSGLQTSNISSALSTTYEDQLALYRTPTLMTQPNETTEVGTPLVNSTGELVGMHVGTNSAATMPVTALAAFLNLALPKRASTSALSPVYENWKNGMDAYYNQATGTAHTSFQKAYAANGGFQAAQHFATLTAISSSQSNQNAQSTGGQQRAISTTQGGLTVNGVQVPYGQLALFLAILVALVLFVLLINWRARSKRRKRALDAELADAEQHATIDAQRIRMAELEALQSQVSGSSSPLPAIEKTGSLGIAVYLCPRCSKVVNADARSCSNCQQPLVPADASIQRRGYTPLPAVYSQANGVGSPVPGRPPASAASSIAEQPTVVPAGAIAEQPTIVPGRSIAEQPTVDITSASEQVADGQNDSDKTIPYAMRHLSGQRLGFVVGARSDPGIKRKYKPNEDSLFVAQGAVKGSARPPMFGLFVVADGMGGHANGEDASRLAIQTVINYLLPKIVGQGLRQGDTYTRLLVEGVQEANLAVHQNNVQQNCDMGTTVTGALFVDGIAYVANVGDSRTYLYRPGAGLKKVTTDHSVVASLVEAGIIKPDDIYTHPKRNQIYRSLGEKPVVEIDSFMVQLQPGDKLILCSDGLWDMVRDPKIEAVIKEFDGHPADIGDGLIQAALEGGGEDNVSVIVVHMTEAVEMSGFPAIQLIAKPDSVQMPTLQ